MKNLTVGQKVAKEVPKNSGEYKRGIVKEVDSNNYEALVDYGSGLFRWCNTDNLEIVS